MSETMKMRLGMIIAVYLWSCASSRADDAQARQIVARVVEPLMQRDRIPGMAVGIVSDGRGVVFNFGVASSLSKRPVDDDTLFEIGSITKTFTATLACYAQIGGQLSFSDHPGKYLPALKGSRFDETTLLNLGTHTSGGLPLQVPEGIVDDDQLMRYLQDDKPAYVPGTHRTYSNLSIGVLGLCVARSMGADFTALVEGKLFPAFGLKHTFLNLPENQGDNYAQGYNEDDAPVRFTPGVLAAPTYGIRTTAGDLLRWAEANMRLIALDQTWQQAAMQTHTGYFRVGPMTQDLIWEQYAAAAPFADLLAGNSPDVILKPNPVSSINPPAAPGDDCIINKTGSTEGFGAYVVFSPARKAGVILLANKRFPIEERVTAAHTMMEQLSAASSSQK